MRAMIATKARFAGFDCKLNCGRKIQVKDIVLHQRMNSAAYGDRDWVCHARCMDGMVAKSLDLTEKGGNWNGQGQVPSSRRRFERIRQKMLDEGTAFVDA